MVFLDDSFGDLKYEDEGKWVEYASNPDGSIPRIKIRRAHSRHKSYMAGLTAITKKYKGSRIADIDDKVVAEAYSKYLILAWENFQCPASLTETFGLKEHENIPFSKDNSVKLFLARRRFLDDIHKRVHDEEEFEAEEDEVSSKN